MTLTRGPGVSAAEREGNSSAALRLRHGPAQVAEKPVRKGEKERAGLRQGCWASWAENKERRKKEIELAFHFQMHFQTHF